MSLTHYAVLGIADDATPEQIKKAYQKQARQTHPDTGGEHTAHLFSLINDAYETLRDPDKRAAYDRSLRNDAPTPEPQPEYTQPNPAYERPQPQAYQYAGPPPPYTGLTFSTYEEELNYYRMHFRPEEYNAWQTWHMAQQRQYAQQSWAQQNVAPREQIPFKQKVRYFFHWGFKSKSPLNFAVMVTLLIMVGMSTIPGNIIFFGPIGLIAGLYVFRPGFWTRLLTYGMLIVPIATGISVYRQGVVNPVDVTTLGFFALVLVSAFGLRRRMKRTGSIWGRAGRPELKPKIKKVKVSGDRVDTVA